MCGLAGIFTSNGLRAAELTCAVERMASSLGHRGPDDGGVWADPAAGIAFGFRRLAIIDLSEGGHQPMRSHSGRYTLVFNGEVYDHRTLREELERWGYPFRGRSDTEVVAAAFERWGIAGAAARLAGMFAIAVWDAETRRLSLFRDRVGIKPMFVSARPGLVTFGSELKALVAGPCFDRTLDRDALTDYLRYLYVPAPRTIYRHAFKLLPGHVLTIEDPARPLPATTSYWSADEVARRGLAEPFTGSETAAIDALEHRLAGAVERHMESDVPLGALLSGGIDSTVVVALMQRAAARPVKTYSIAFDVSDYDEAPHAAHVAQHLGTDHTELMVTGADALNVVPRLADIFDEPHADVSQIPALLICAAARREVTVALSGDGGDEVFGGYNRYRYDRGVLGCLVRLPPSMRRGLAARMQRVSPASWSGAARALAPVVPSMRHGALAADRFHKVGRVLAAESPTQMYRTLVSAWQRPETLVVGSAGGDDAIERILAAPGPGGMLERVMLADQLTYLPDDQLAKVDRVSMSVSLELRVPLVDHEVVEFAWTLPSSMKVRGGQGKWVLREVLHRLVPGELVDRPKQGLSVPLDAWLRGPLREWAEDLLARERLERDGILHSAPIREAWSALLAGHGRHAQALWALLLFQQWRQRWLA